MEGKESKQCRELLLSSGIQSKEELFLK